MAALGLLRQLVNTHQNDTDNIKDIQALARKMLREQPPEGLFLCGVPLPVSMLSFAMRWADDGAKDIFEQLGFVAEEMTRQNHKWGAQRQQSPLEWLAILTEEVGEVAKEAVDGHFGSNSKARLGCARAMRSELIHVAAVAIQAAASIYVQTNKIDQNERTAIENIRLDGEEDASKEN